MATIPLQRARVARTISGNSPQVLTLPEAATQSFKRGEFVYLSGGKVTEIGDDPGYILGMADQDASTTTDTAIAVVIANNDTIFELNKVSDSTTASATATAAATAVTDVGREFGIHRDTTANKTYATILGGAGAGTGARLICLDLSNFDVVGDTGGRLLCMVMGAYRQLFCTS